MRGDFSTIMATTTLWNALVASLAEGLPLQGRGQALLRLSPETDPDQSPTYEVDTQAGPLWLQLRQLPLGPITRSELTLPALAALPPALADAILSLAVDALRALIGPALQPAIRGISRSATDPIPPGAERILAQLDGGWGEMAEILILADRAVLVDLTRDLVAAQPRPSLPEGMARAIPMACTLRLSGRTVPHSLLAALRPGDIILPDRQLLSLWAPHARFDLAHDGTNWTITEVAMNDEYPDTPASAPEQDLPEQERPGQDRPGQDMPDLGALPVRLSFLLAEQTLTLAQVQDLAPGALLPFQPDLPETGPEPGHAVRILANGQPIGSGHVVQVDGQPAIRIARLAAKG